MANLRIRRGDVIRVDLRGAEGVEKQKTRPCVVVQNDVGNSVSPMTIVAPLTDAVQWKKLPVQVLVPAAKFGTAVASPESGLQGKDGVVECGHLRAIDRDLRVDSSVGVLCHLDSDVMADVDRAIRSSLGL